MSSENVKEPDQDIQTKSETETKPEAEVEKETKPESEVETETKPESEVETETKLKSEEETGTKPESETETKLESEVATETKPESEIVTETKPESDVVTETKPESDVVTETKPESEVVIETKPESEVVTETNLEDEPEDKLSTDLSALKHDLSEDEITILTEYDTSQYHSSALQSENGTIPINTFQFIYSFGYDCQRYYNMCTCDENVVAWAAGSYITFYNIKSKKFFFRRSSTGGSIGHIAKNPSPHVKHIAVGEGGLHWAEPLILIYEWPDLTIVAVLKKGTQQTYSHLDYSPDGNLLASVGGAPDYYLTIWDWQKHRIMLQTSAFSFNVNNVLFSPYIHGQLTTSGASHVKFWKMSPTFTGLKLKGELGRFGKTEICDILGVYPMPDEKVLSGCTWGNILVWEGGLVKVEISRRGRVPCHAAPITQFLRNAETNEVTTISLDGTIRSWYWDTVEQADPPDDDRFVELNPVAELKVEGAQFMSISHRKGSFWFAQDGRGSIWTIDLDVDSRNWVESKCETRWHGSGIVGLAMVRGPDALLVSLGSDGTLAVSRSPSGPLLCISSSFGEASTMFYLPKKIDRSGRTFILGFADGYIQVIILLTDLLGEDKGIVTDESCVGTLQLLKPHTKSVNAISANDRCDTLVTTSMDCTIFMYHLQSKKNVPELVPLCYIDTPKAINYVCWNPFKELSVVLCGNEGLLLEADLPIFETPPPPDTITYHNFFVSSRANSLKEYILRYTPPIDEDDMPFIDSDEEEEEQKEEEEDDIEVELFAVNNNSKKRILWAIPDHNNEGYVWMAQESLGCLLHYQLGAPILSMFAPLQDSWEIDITSFQYINENHHMLLGMANGEIRVIRLPLPDEDKTAQEFEIRMMKRQKKLKKMKGKPKDEPELIPRMDFMDFLRFPMHNNLTGAITQMIFSNNLKYFFTAGMDGNIFSYEYNLIPDLLKEPSSFDLAIIDMPPKIGVELTDEEMELSHEELAQEKERQALLRAANLYKQGVQDQIAELTIQFRELFKLNNLMPPLQQVPITVDPRVLLEEERLAGEKMALVRRKMAYPLAVSSLQLNKMLQRNIQPLDVFPFQVDSIVRKDYNVKTIRQKKLPPRFYDDLEIVKNNYEEALLKAQGNLFMVPQMSVDKYDGEEEQAEKWGVGGPSTPLLHGLPPVPPPPRALVRALRHYMYRLNRHHQQEMEWREHLSKRSFESVERAGMAALMEAEATIGEFHLKSRPAGTQGPSTNVKDPAPLQSTHLQLFITRQEIYEIQHEFNNSLLALRQDKSALVERYAELTKRLIAINEELPKSMRQGAPTSPPPIVDVEREFPERNLQVKQPERRYSNVMKRRSLYMAIPKIIIQPKNPKLTELDPIAQYWEKMKMEAKERKGQAPHGTTMEQDFKHHYITRLIVEQEQILMEMKESVDSWEERLTLLGRERERVLLRGQFLRLHLIYLTQRHLILDSFQHREDSLMDQVRKQQEELKETQDVLKKMLKNIDVLVGGIANTTEQIKQVEIQQRRLGAEAPKFTKFLRHVYKKKQKAPKLQDDDSSDEESSESSSEEESDEDDEDNDVVRLRLDSTECPPGCDPQIYEETIELRQIRYDLENDIKEQEKEIEISKKNVEASTKESRILTRKLEERQKLLRELLETKQGLLNVIECAVIISAERCGMEALRGVMSGQHACEGSGALLFPAPLIAQLNSRVSELHSEALDQKKRHSINKAHLRHMQQDCKYMEQRIVDLRTHGQRILSNKLAIGKSRGKMRKETEASQAGRILDTVLAGMAQDFKVLAASGFTIDMRNQLAEWKQKENYLQQKYCTLLQEHTNKLRMASALQAEIQSKTASKAIKEMLGGRTEEEYRRDIVRLRRLRREQRQQIEDLKIEIHHLKFKPICSEREPQALPSPSATAPPSERATPPTPAYKNAKMIATTLANCLKEGGLEIMTDINSDRCLLDNIASIIPQLLIGKIDVHGASEKILRSLSLSAETEDNIVQLDKCRQEINDILRRIMKENLDLGEMQPLCSVTIVKKEVSIGEAGSDTVGSVVRVLLDLGATSQHSNLIDAAVSGLIDDHPDVIDKDIDAKSVSNAVLSQTKVYSEEQVTDIVKAVLDCLIAQSVGSEDDEAEEPQQTAVTVVKSALKKESSRTSVRSTGYTSKKVSVAEGVMSAPTTGNRSSRSNEKDT